MNNTKPTSEISTPDGRTTEFKTYANYLRARIADLGRLVQCFKKHPAIQNADLRFCKVESDRGEMAANIVLSFRHLEDASMRLGKAIQAYDGGVSCYNADMGHGQEIPKGPDAVNAEVAIDLKFGEHWVRDISGNQITQGAYKWLQTLAHNLGHVLGHTSVDGRSTYHMYNGGGLRVASFGEIKSVFVFLVEQLTKKLAASGEVVHADAISWPAGETAQPEKPLPAFVQPPQPFQPRISFDEWTRSTARELGFQTSQDIFKGYSFHKRGEATSSRYYNSEAEVRDFLTQEEKKRNDEVRAADNRVKMLNREYSQKPFTDESHSA